MALGRISGPLLKANLLRQGVDLAFETDLLYLDVVNGRIGIHTAAPTHDLQVVGTTRTTNLEVTNQADIATFTFLGNVISSSNGTIRLESSGTNPVVYQGKIQTGNLQLSTNVIETLGTNENLVIKTLGTGQVNVNANMYVDGDIYATGNISAGGDITIGNTDGDSIIFKADIASNLIPNITNTYDLGSNNPSSLPIYSYNFSGSNGIRLPVNTNLSFGTTGDFTIEFWMKAGPSQSTYATITDSSTNNQATAISVGINNGGVAGKLSFKAAGGSGTISGATTVLDNNWHHIACVKHGSNGYIFVDGVLDASTTSWGSINNAYLSGGSVGRSAFGSGTNSDNTFTGYLSNFRVIKGLALYTTNFVPPTQVLTVTAETQLLILKTESLIDESLNSFVLTAQSTFPVVSTTEVPSIINPSGGIKEWRTVYGQDIITTDITSDTAVVNGIDLVLPQGNTIYVAKNGNDANAGVHENNPLLTVKAALTQAVAGDTVMIYAGEYEEEFPLTVPVGVTVRGAGLRAVTIKPTTATRYNDAFLLNGETTVEDLAVTDFFSGGNFFTVTAASAGSTTVNVGTSPFAHTYVSGGTIKIGITSYNITNAVYTHTTGVLVLTHTGGTATPSESVFVSNLTFSCAGAVGTSTRVFPDNGYAFRFADGITVTSRSPYVRNVSVLTKGSVTSPTDPLGFDQVDAGKGAYIDGAYANVASKEAAMLFHSVTFITPNVDTITAKNGVRVEWLNSFTYFANKGINAISSAYGFAQQGETRLRINNRIGTWAVGNTVSYYDTDGTTLLASGVISSVDGDYINLTGNCAGFQTITDRVGKTVYAQGDAKLSTSQFKFGTASLALDGTGDYATVASNPDFAFSTGDFTIEAWIYRTLDTGTQTIFDFRTAGVANAPLLYFSGGSIVYYVAGSARITGAASVPDTNVWYHIALARSGTDTKLFVNGTQVGSTWSDSTDYIQGPLYIGASYTGAAGFLSGYIDDLRISKGVARYTGATYTVPTAKLPGDLNTVLLLHFDGTNNSTQFLDDGITFQDLRTSAGGTASLINFADYSDFGAEIRSIGSANVYGNYGTYGDGQGVVIYLISQNYAYVGAGKKSTNDPNDRIAANEVVELNNAEIYYTSVDNEGNFSVGDSFYVNQKTGDVLFGGQALNITALSGITFTDGTNTTIVTATNIDTGNIRVSGNTVESLTGNLNITAANGEINLQNNTYVTGNVDITGDLTLGGNIQIGDNPGDIIDFVGSIGSDIIPATTATYNLGQGGLTPLRWNNIYLGRAEIDGVVIDDNTISTTIGNDNLILTAAGIGEIYIPTNDVQLDQNLTVTQDLTVTTGTTYLKNTEITGSFTHVGDLNQTGNFTTTGLTQVTGNIVGTGYLELPQIKISGNLIETRVAGTDLQLTANGTGNIVFEGYKVTDNNIQITSLNTDLVLTPQGTGSVVINSNQSLIIPVGTTAERPATGTETNGMIRYNTTLGQYEGWNGTYWLKLSGVQDLDGNTYIKAEATPGANDNTLYFYADNNLMVTIDSTKLFAERLQTNNLDIQNNTITTLLSNSDIVLATPGTGGVKVGNLQIRNNTITNTVSGAVTEFTESGTGYVKFAGSNGVVIPSGNNAARPSYAITGMTRFNTELGIMEVYDGLTWVNVAGTSSGVTFNEATDIGIGIVLTLG